MAVVEIPVDKMLRQVDRVREATINLMEEAKILYEMSEMRVKETAGISNKADDSSETKN